MKRYISILMLAAVSMILVSSCEEFLDRPSKTTMTDENYWSSEATVRMFANGYYPLYFNGYASGWTVDYTPLRGYYFSDDFTSSGTQSGFETVAPSSRYATTETASWILKSCGPNWNFALIRKSNLFINRLAMMEEKGNLTGDQYNHWNAVARFFRGYEYSRLVSVFGDVPLYDRSITESELDELYKDRNNRGEVMDQVYDDYVYVLDNMRLSDGTGYLNRYIAAGFISRHMLFEGTWQKYHNNNQEKAKKYLELAVRAGNLVIDSGKWSFESDFRSLFGSFNLANNKEVMMYREYNDALAVRHHIASYSNATESQSPAPNLALAKSFICNDGQPYQTTTVEDGDKLDLYNMLKTRDPRFEATFYERPLIESNTLLYACKFIDRVGPTYKGGTYPPQYGSVTNTNWAPVMRLGEVVLNWIEAKAELATMGGAAVTQSDIDKSINGIRNRPLDDVAIAKGVQKTAPLFLSAIPNDPARDSDVSPLLWEIRRERRMEFVYEHSRLLDIKRWKKINYMDGDVNPDILRGLWIDFPAEKASGNFNWDVTARVGILKVEDANGNILTYDGTNFDQMVGFYVPQNIRNRDPFTDRVYLTPLGITQISEYKDKGYTLTQNPGWESN